MKSKFVFAYMDTAKRFAQLSTARKLKVGSIIVKDNRIISIGYNGMPSGWSNECEDVDRPIWMDWEPRGEDELGMCRLKSKPEVLHAEANAISKVARSAESCEDAVLFCTHTPCIECAKLIYQSGIKTVYFGEDYVASKGSGKQFLINCGIEMIKVPSEYLEDTINPMNDH
jgi:dCMP deaminase